MYTLKSAPPIVCLARLRFNEALESPFEVAIVLLERFLSDEWENDFDLLEADFFDDECMVIIYRLRTRPSKLGLTLGLELVVIKVYSNGLHRNSDLQRLGIPVVAG